MTASNHCSQSLKLQPCQKMCLPVIVALRKCPWIRLFILPVIERALFSANAKGILKSYYHIIKVKCKKKDHDQNNFYSFCNHTMS